MDSNEQRIDVIVLESESPYTLDFTWDSLDDFGPCRTARISSGRLARLALTEDLDTEQVKRHSDVILAAPRTLVYVGGAMEPGLYAQLYAKVPGEELYAAGEWGAPRDQHVALFLGIVVRFARDLDPAQTLEEQCAAHFAAIIQGRCVEPVDKILESL